MRKFVASVALAIAVVMGGVLGTSPAKASTFIFSFFDTETGGSNISASGLLTASPSGPDYLITGISGTYNGNAITSLFAPGGFQGNNNILHSGSPQLDILGFAFSVAALPRNVNIYYDAVGGSDFCPTRPGYCDYHEPGAIDTPIAFSATLTPLPAALPLFATGLGAVGLLGWRRKRKAAAALAAA
jgi:hypothetical protein